MIRTLDEKIAEIHRLEIELSKAENSNKHLQILRKIQKLRDSL